MLSILELIVFGVASLYLVFLVIPALNGVETWCFLDGPETPAAGRYVTAIFLIGLGSWLATIIATVLAFRRARPTLGVLLPLGWFLGLAALATIITLAMGPQPCQGELSIF